MDDQQRRNSLKEIVESIDGGNVFTGCGLGLTECSELNPCPIHSQFKEIRNKLSNMMANTTIEELATKLKSGESVLSRR
jgi:DNA-binding IscR family transcriptional regulator